jgi:pimeloyl-ACP methyl ester carboxylesterase
MVSRVVFVHGACVRDGAWWWHRTAALLAERGVDSATPVLPSCGETGAAPGWDGPGLTDDVQAVRAVLLESDAPTVVVGHSYGGIVLAEAAVGIAAVRHAVFVSSYLAEVGQSLSTFGGDEPAPFLQVDPERGIFGGRPEVFPETFMADCDDATTAQALERLAWQSASVTQQPVQTAAWHDVPTTYLVCTQDCATPPARQREFARRAGSVVEIEAGHHPFLSRPREVAELLLALES